MLKCWFGARACSTPHTAHSLCCPAQLLRAMHGRKKSDLPQTKEEKDAVQAKISNYKKASRNFVVFIFKPTQNPPRYDTPPMTAEKRGQRDSYSSRCIARLPDSFLLSPYVGLIKGLTMGFLGLLLLRNKQLLV